MQTDILDSFTTLSPECRQELRGQVELVRTEARRLKEQLRHLRKAERAERERVQHLHRVEHAEREREQRTGKHTQRAARAEQKERERALKQIQAERMEETPARGQGWMQRLFSQEAAFIPADARQEHTLLKGRARDYTPLRENTTGQLYRQGQEMKQNMADWKDDLAYTLLRQGQHFLQYLIDRRDETTRNLRKQGRNLGRKLVDRTDDVTWQLQKQRRQLGRNLSEQRADVTRQLRRRGKEINRNLGELNTFWSTVGFTTGLLLAGGSVYWLLKRMYQHHEEAEEQHIELQEHGTLNGFESSGSYYGGQGGVAVATRRTTRAEPTSRFVGVLSTQRYYPIARQTELSAYDLVYFRSEEDARAEGFLPA